MSRRCRGTAGTDTSLPHGSGPVVSPQARLPPPPPSPAPAHKHTRFGTRPQAVPAAPGSPEAHRSGRCQATSSSPAALTPGGVPSPAPAHNRTLAFFWPSLGSAYRGVADRFLVRDQPLPVTLPKFLTCPCSATSGPSGIQRVLVAPRKRA